MALSGYDKNSDSSGLSDPFEDVDVDFDTQTGADWYALALSASLGGKSVHGVTFAPTMETLAKVTPEYAEKYAHGTIQIDDRLVERSAAEDSPDMLPYAGRDFKGIHSSAGTTMAFDTGAWEPSTRTRARNTALLAATLSSGAGDTQKARDFAAFVSASPVPEEAVTQALIPLSVLKRECVAVSKTDHAIYTRGTTQRRIRWEDSTMVAEKFSPAAAVDWGRLTTIARYIAEANARYDPDFVEVAKTSGVPYCLVRGAWASVSPGDFVPPDTPEYKVPDLAPHNIPTLVGAYEGHVTKLVYAAEVALAAHTDVGNPEGMQQLLTIVEKLRKLKPDRKHTVATGGENIAELIHHSFSADTAAAKVAKSGTAYQALIAAGQQWALEDKNIERLACEIAVLADKGEVNPEKTNALSIAWLKPPPWILALNILARQLNAPDTARERLAKYRRTITGSSVMWHTPISATKLVLANMEPFTIGIAKKMAVPTKAPLNLPPIMAAVDGLAGRKAVAVAADYVRHHLTGYAETWAKRYQEKSRAYGLVGGVENKRMAVLYSLASYAFKSVSVAGVLSSGTGYVDMSTPHDCYLFHAAKNYARKRRLGKPKVPATPLSSAAALAELLDQQYQPSVPFTEAEEFARSKLEMFAGDLCIAMKPEDPEEVTHDNDIQIILSQLPKSLPEEPAETPMTVQPAAPVIVENEVKQSTPAQTAEAIMRAKILEMMAYKPPELSLEQKVLRSYTGVEQAEKHAKANGYGSFAEAFAALREGARFDPDFDYTAKGLSLETAQEAEEAGEGDAMFL